jgi:uncharacterized protein (TIGR03435 family)
MELTMAKGRSMLAVCSVMAFAFDVCRYRASSPDVQTGNDGGFMALPFIGALVCSLALCSLAMAQTLQLIDDTKLPRFEVASVKPGDPNADRGSFGTPAGRFVQENVNLVSALLLAFGARPYQFGTLPDLILRDSFSINARMPAGAARADVALMVRALLIDRFKLRYHVERKEEDAYVLTLVRLDGRLGPQLHSSPVDCAARMSALQQKQELPPQPPGTVECGMRNGRGLINFGGMPMSLLVQMLSSQTGKQVVDRTGLSGNFDVELQWSPESTGPLGTNPNGQPPTPGDPPSIFTAVQEQLGLKLGPGKAPVDRIVIDHIERPDPD